MHQIILIILLLILTWTFRYIWKWLEGRSIVIEGLQTINHRMSVPREQYAYDKLFDNVIYFANSSATSVLDSSGQWVSGGANEEAQVVDRDIANNLSTGEERCALQCPGHCVSFGLSGSSTCFIDVDRFNLQKNRNRDTKEVNLFRPHKLANDPNA